MWEGTQRAGMDAQPDDTTGRRGKTQAGLGAGLRLKGEISGSEDLYIDGEVEGKIELKGNNLIIGPNGKVRADVTATSITIQGHLRGKVQVSERTQILAGGTMEGELVTARIVVDEGAVLRGRVDTVRPGQGEAELQHRKKPVGSAPSAQTTERPTSAGLR